MFFFFFNHGSAMLSAKKSLFFFSLPLGMWDLSSQIGVTVGPPGGNTGRTPRNGLG